MNLIVMQYRFVSFSFPLPPLQRDKGILQFSSSLVQQLSSWAAEQLRSPHLTYAMFPRRFLAMSQTIIPANGLLLLFLRIACNPGNARNSPRPLSYAIASSEILRNVSSKTLLSCLKPYIRGGKFEIIAKQEQGASAFLRP